MIPALILAVVALLSVLACWWRDIRIAQGRIAVARLRRERVERCLVAGGEA